MIPSAICISLFLVAVQAANSGRGHFCTSSIKTIQPYKDCSQPHKVCLTAFKTVWRPTTVCCDGYTGEACDIAASNNVNSLRRLKRAVCTADFCQNGGTCTPGYTQTCTCTSDFTGSTCLFAVDPCAANPCSNGGTCVQNQRGFTCKCLGIFTGSQCTDTTCTGIICQNGGTCTPNDIDFHCACALGFNGTNCQFDPCNGIPGSPCQNGGTCSVVEQTSFACACPTGYKGSNCQYTLCNPNPCLNGGLCTVNGTDFTCVCVAGFNGSLCAVAAGLSAGAIVGIVIGVLLFLLLLFLLLFCCLFWLPRRRRLMGAGGAIMRIEGGILPFMIIKGKEEEKKVVGHIRATNDYGIGNSKARKGEVNDNGYIEANRTTDVSQTLDIGNLMYSNSGVAVEVGMGVGDRVEQSEMQKYGAMVMSDRTNVSWILDDRQLRFGKVVATGQLAEILLATHETNNGSQTIVAKKLKGTLSANERNLMLMRARMNFWATNQPRHENIINFIGALPNGGPGPVLFFEFCDSGVLSDWLKTNTKITTDVEANLLSFTLDIANGMRHLHDNNITHGRLGVRNVLLSQNEQGRLVAKIAGLGPLENEYGNDDKVPLRWLAPEQMILRNKERRLYNKKTDVWTYGITVWEIFNLGEAPYPGISLSNMKTLVVQKKYRMPKPTDCPNEMYDYVMTPCWEEQPTDRADFNVIARNVNDVIRTLETHQGDE